MSTPIYDRVALIGLGLAAGMLLQGAISRRS